MVHKMILFFSSNLLLCVLFLHVVAGDDSFDQSQCIDEYKTMTKQPIPNITAYCEDKNCIIKCCPEDEILDAKGACRKANPINFKKLYPKVNYANESLYSYDGSKYNKTKKNFKNLDRVFNTLLSNANCTYDAIGDPFYILEDGSLKTESMEYEPLSFCVDYRIYGKKINSKNIWDLKFIYRFSVEQEDSIRLDLIIAIGMWISCFFMILVLAVHCALPNLRNIVGMMLMAYVSTLCITYMMKACSLVTQMSTDACKIFAPILYFFTISSFFWLNVMSFDLWWTFRGYRKCQEIHRRGQIVKFIWYGLFAWGTPLLMTLVVTLVDHLLANNKNIIRPHFEYCFADDAGVKTYMHIPIGIILGTNLLLFFLTTYNIWVTKRRVCKNPNSRSTKQDENRFGIYIKLSVIMGVCWVVELLPDDKMPNWLFIVLNFCNCFLGVVIFFLFVFKKKTFIALCTRYNINNRFVKALQNRRNYSESASGRSLTFKSTFKSQTQDSTSTTTV